MNRSQYEYHPTIGYKFIPNLRTRIQHEAGGYLVRTNSHGFRSDGEFAPGRSSGKRALVFGDSFTAGDGVSNKHRYTDLLQASMEGTEFFNFGLPGSGTDQHYLIYREIGRLFEHDLLVIVVSVENIRRVNAQYRYFLDAEGETKVWQKPYFELDGDALRLRNVPVHPQPIPVSQMDEEARAKIDTGGRHEGLRKFVRRLGMKDVVQKLVRFQPLPEYSRPSNPEWVLMKALLAHWIGESEVPVLLVPLPLFHHVEETASAKSYQARFAELSGLCRIHDPLPDLLRYDAEARRGFRFKTDVHLTREGHQAVAESLIPVVKGMLAAS